MQYEGGNLHNNFNYKYEFKTNVNKSLSEILDIPEIVMD